MKIFVSDEQYEYVVCNSEWQSLSGFWDYLGVFFKDFYSKKEAFFLILERALVEGRLVLKKNGSVLLGEPRALIDEFRSKFPKEEFPDSDHPDLDASYWFYDPECPGEAAWPVERNGKIEWEIG